MEQKRVTIYAGQQQVTEPTTAAFDDWTRVGLAQRKVPVGGEPAEVISVIYTHPNPSEPAFY